MKKALITGITGQDGSYLAEFLLGKGYEVHGIKRRASSFNTERIDHIYEDLHQVNKRLFLHYGDMTDSAVLMQLITTIQPDEIYNLAAQSHVKVSFDIPEYTANTDALGVLRMIEAIKSAGLIDRCKFYQASTSELYGGMGYNMPSTGYTETSPFHPRSPYGVAKLYAYRIVKNYAESYGLYGCNGILFNHESPRRGETFVSRKITRGIARISLGVEDVLYLGNLDAERDRGHAKDYVEAMWLMLQQEKADNYVIAMGEKHSVRKFVELTCHYAGIPFAWKGSGVDEVGYNTETGKVIVKIDPRYYRPAEVAVLLGDSTKAKAELGREPRYSFAQMVEEMVTYDLNSSFSMLYKNNALKDFKQSLQLHKQSLDIMKKTANIET